MPSDNEKPTDTGVEARRVGLCMRCRHARVKANSRGGAFWRCGLADKKPELPRYPTLPVLRCREFRES